MNSKQLDEIKKQLLNYQEWFDRNFDKRDLQSYNNSNSKSARDSAMRICSYPLFKYADLSIFKREGISC